MRSHRFLSSAIAPVEVISALSRRQAAGDLASHHLNAIMAQLAKDRAYWELVEVSSLVLARAEHLIPRTGLRTLDAIHLASVIAFQEAAGMPSARIPFITAHHRDAASRLGLEVRWVG